MLTAFLTIMVVGLTVAVAYLVYTSLTQAKAINELGGGFERLRSDVIELKRIEEVVHPTIPPPEPEKPAPRKRKRTRP